MDVTLMAASEPRRQMQSDSTDHGLFDVVWTHPASRRQSSQRRIKTIKMKQKWTVIALQQKTSTTTSAHENAHACKQVSSSSSTATCHDLKPNRCSLDDSPTNQPTWTGQLADC